MKVETKKQLAPATPSGKPPPPDPSIVFVGITSPANGSTVNGTPAGATISVSGTASADNDKVTSSGGRRPHAEPPAPATLEPCLGEDGAALTPKDSFRSSPGQDAWLAPRAPRAPR
jgi:hypothetical protein